MAIIELEKSSGVISITKFGLKVNSTRYTEHNTKINIDKVLNLASNHKEYFNLGLHIIQHQ